MGPKQPYLDRLDPPFKRRVSDLVAQLPSKDHREISDLLRRARVRSFESLYARLSDEQSDLRPRLCYLAGLIGDRRSAVPRLAGLITGSNDRAVRVAAAGALSTLGGVRARRALERALLADADPEVRMQAATSLGVLADPASVPSLLTALNSASEDVEVRSAAAEALGYVADPTAVPDLLALLDNRDVRLRFWTTFALGHFADRRLLKRLNRVEGEDEGILPGVGSVKEEARQAAKQIETLLRDEDR
jgi:HEAT repeat protein